MRPILNDWCEQVNDVIAYRDFYRELSRYCRSFRYNLRWLSHRFKGTEKLCSREEYLLQECLSYADLLSNLTESKFNAIVELFKNKE